ncbi:E4 ORF1 [Bat mastadenovirus]|nr:E4 ORF1 [Bat mastadenovirus]
MSPTPQELAWTFEIRVFNTEEGDVHYDGRYLETLLSRARQCLTREFDCFTCFDAFCSCLSARTVYLGGFIRRCPSLGFSSLYLSVGSAYHYGPGHHQDYAAHSLSEQLGHFLRTSCLEEGFSPNVQCVPVPNALAECVV